MEFSKNVEKEGCGSRCEKRNAALSIHEAIIHPEKGPEKAIGDWVWRTNEKTTFKKSRKKKNDAVRFAWARKSRFKFSFLVNCGVRPLVMGSRAAGPAVPY